MEILAIYGGLAPKLADYGLVKIVDNGIYIAGNNNPIYIISDIGRRFHSLLQKYYLHREQLNIT
jgi:hypothetical protein